MTTHVQGSFHTVDGFTVRTTLTAIGDADWVVAAGTTYATADAALAAWNTAISGISVSVARNVNASRHDATVVVTTSGPTFSVDWSHAGDGTTMRDFLGESANLTTEASGYRFDNPLAAAWFPSYDLRRLDVSGQPWDVQRLMTGGGAVQANNPHHGTTDDLMYEARAEFWFGYDVGSSYYYYEALRNLIEGILEYGQPFVITTDADAYTCRLANIEQLELIPEPVTDVERGDIYRVTLPVVVVD